MAAVLCVPRVEAEAALLRRLLGSMTDAELEARLGEYLEPKGYEVRISAADEVRAVDIGFLDC